MRVHYNLSITSPVFKTTSEPVANSGEIRLGNTDEISWRDNSDSSDLPLAVNGSNQLTFNGSILSTGGATPPGGSNTQVQFNDSGAFGGDSGFTYNKSTKEITAAGQFVSTVSTGTAPFTIASTTLVSNLNVEFLNGQPGSFYSSGNSFKNNFLLMGG